MFEPSGSVSYPLLGHGPNSSIKAHGTLLPSIDLASAACLPAWPLAWARATLLLDFSCSLCRRNRFQKCCRVVRQPTPGMQALLLSMLPAVPGAVLPELIPRFQT